MDGYERVTELQEISLRSAGATAAQAGVYLEGLEASLNKIRVSWEAFVQKLVDSEVVINIVNFIAKAVEGIANVLSNTSVLFTLLTAIGVQLATNVAIKLKELRIEKQITSEKQKQALLEKQEGIAKLASEGYSNVFKGGLKGLKKGGPGLKEGIKKGFKGGGGIGGLMKTLGTAVMVGVAVKSVFSIVSSLIDWRSEAEKTTESIKKLNNEAFKQNKQSNELKTIIDKYEALDNKILKTAKDHEELNSLINSAGDQLTEEEKAAFDQMNLEDKKAYIEQKQKDAQKAAKETNEKIIKDFADTKDKAALLKDPETKAILKNTARWKLFDELDAKGGLSKEEKATANKFIAKFSDHMSDEQMSQILQNKDAANNLISTFTDKKNIESFEKLNDASASIADRVNSFEALKQNLGESSEAAKVLSKAFSEIEEISNKLGHNKGIVFDWMDKNKIDIEDINKLGESYKGLTKVGMKDIGQDAYNDLILTKIVPALARGEKVQEIFAEHFADLLEEGKEMNELTNLFIDDLSSMIGKNILEAGQSMDEYKNEIESYYKTASEWSDMSETDKTSFISSHTNLFKGEEGAKLLEALEQGNFAEIEKALGSSEYLEKKRQETLKWVEDTLNLEKQKTEDAQNKAYISQLEQYKEYLNDKEKMFSASLKQQLEQQNKQIDVYKDYLSKQKEIQTESLNNRKEAYQKYWADLDKQEKVEDYEEKRKVLESNLMKIGTTSGFATESKRKELESQLKDLEKERAKELRQEAREQVVENIDKEINKISKDFDKLLNNQQALLTMLGKELENPGTLMSKLIESASSDGMTGLQLKDYVNSLQSTFGSSVKNMDWSSHMNNSNNNYTLHFNGQTYSNGSDSFNILELFKKLGIGG